MAVIGRRQTFRLFVDDVNEKEPNDISYVYSGYAPLSVRLVQAAVSKAGLKPLEETLKLLPGPTFDETQQLPAGLQAKSASFAALPLPVPACPCLPLPAYACPCVPLPVPARTRARIPLRGLTFPVVGLASFPQNRSRRGPRPRSPSSSSSAGARSPRSRHFASCPTRATVRWAAACASWSCPCVLPEPADRLVASCTLALPAGQRDYIVATTKLINGSTLLESIIESVENKTM